MAISNKKTKKIVTTTAKVKPKKKRLTADEKETAILIKIGKIAAANAIRETQALGLPIVYMEKGIIYREFVDGTREIIKDSSEEYKASIKNSPKYKKGMRFHAKK